MLRFRYGVQVNSLGLTESQPENNVPRIVLEALAVTLGRDARARAIQLPAWNEALGLPRPWDQQWSLRIQQILADETDLLDYPDIFEGSEVMEGLVAELESGAREEMAVVEEHGGAVEAVPYMKARLVESHRERVAKIERGELKVVGQNAYTETEDSPLTADAEGGILKPDPEVERERVEALEQWRAERDEAAVDQGARRPGPGRLGGRGRTSCRRRSRPRRLAPRPASGPACCATPSATTAPRPASAVPPRPATWAFSRRFAGGSTRSRTSSGTGSRSWSESRGSTATPTAPSRSPCGPATPAWRSSTRESGSLPRRSPSRRCRRTSTWSASRSSRARTCSWSRGGSPAHRRRASSVPVVVGGIIPAADAEKLQADGVARVYTPKDFEINRIMGDIVELVAQRNGAGQAPAPA